MSAAVVGDACALPLASSSVDLIVTSPPYYRQRNYDVMGEMGQERTEDLYLDALMRAAAECWRVLKASGTAWVNLGDKRRPNGSKMLLPSRFALRCAAEGWIVVQDQVWAKTTGLDNKATDRTKDLHEYWFHLAKNRRDAYADLDPIREPYAPHTIYCAEVEARLGYTRTRTNPNRVDGGRPKLNIHPLGRMPGSVWTIASEGFDAPRHLRVDHFAAFPKEWPRRLILGWSRPHAVVLDPFGGSGTTAMVARSLGRRGISIDLNPEFASLATWRIHSVPEGTDAARLNTGEPTPEVPGVANEPEAT